MENKRPQAVPLEDLDLSLLTGRKPVDIDVARLAQDYSGKSALVTGGGGSIGSSLAEFLINSGISELTLFDSSEHSLFQIQQHLSGAARRIPIQIVLGDVRDRDKVAYILQRERPQIVFHLAAYKHVPIAEFNADEVAGVNVVGSLNVAEEAMRAGVERLVYPSTDKAVKPPSIYGATKRIVELLYKAISREHHSGTTLKVVRLVNTVGAQGGVIRVFADQISQGLPITITDEAMTRYWISMTEATHFLAQAAFADDVEGIMVLDMGDAVRLTDVAGRLWDILGPEGRDLEVRHVGMRPGERLHELLTYPHEIKHMSQYTGIFDIRSHKTPAHSLSDLLQSVELLKELIKRHDDQEIRQELFSIVEKES